MKRITLTTSHSYLFDPERVAGLHAQIKPDPDVFGDEPAAALLSYLGEGPFTEDVFYDQGDYDTGFDVTDYDPEA